MDSLTCSQLVERIARLEDECDSLDCWRQRAAVRDLIGRCEHELDVRAGLIDPYTGDRQDA